MKTTENDNGNLNGSATPYSISSLFSKLLKKFGGAFLEVCETIQGSMLAYVGVDIQQL